jgi:hypothetical protein
MKKRLLIGLLAGLMMIGMAEYASATLITSTFSDYPGFTKYNTPTIADIDESAQNWYKKYYGISFDHAYMYIDNRDTFDGMGVSNGFTSEIFSENITGKINFIKKTRVVTVDAINLGQSVFFTVYNKKNRKLDSYNFDSDKFSPLGAYSFTLKGRGISYLTFTTLGGYATLSGISYDNKGFLPVPTPGTGPVPEPTTALLFGTGLAGLAAVGRRRRN